MRILLVCFIVTASLFANAQQQKLDASSESALTETQAFMADKAAMEKYAKDHPDAAASMGQVSSLTGGNESDSAAVYKLASEIFSNMTKESAGDGAGMEKILAEAMKNPQAFADKLSPEQKAQLQSLSKKIESRAPTAAPH